MNSYISGEKIYLRAPTLEDAEGQWSAGTPHSPGPLSPIAEGSYEDESLESLDSYFLHDDPDLQAVLAETRCQLDAVLDTSECPSAETGEENELDDRMPLGLLYCPELLAPVYSTSCSNSKDFDPDVADEIMRRAGVCDYEVRDDLFDDEEVLCELAIYPPMLVTVPDAPDVGEDEMLVFQTSAKSATRRVVVQRDDDLLTPEQVNEHWDEVQKSRLKELGIWNDHKCFSRKLRRDARNIIDTRWVIKFKWIHQKDGKWVRTIRARLRYEASRTAVSRMSTDTLEPAHAARRRWL